MRRPRSACIVVAADTVVSDCPALVQPVVAAVDALGDMLSSRWLTHRASNDGVIALDKRGIGRCRLEGDKSVVASQRGRSRRRSVH